MAHIVCLEDEHFEREDLEEALRRYGSVTTIPTESAFRRYIDGIGEGHLPDLLILDQRVPWTTPSPDSPEVPVEVMQDAYEGAGIRSFWYVRDLPTSVSNVPIIFHTIAYHDIITEILTINGLTSPQDYQSVRKGASFRGLHGAVRNALRTA